MTIGNNLDVYGTITAKNLVINGSGQISFPSISTGSGAFTSISCSGLTETNTLTVLGNLSCGSITLNNGAISTGTTGATFDSNGASQLQSNRSFSLTGNAKADGVSFNGTDNVALQVYDVKASKVYTTSPVSGTYYIPFVSSASSSDSQTIYAKNTLTFDTASGKLTATYVGNMVWNDIADLIEVPDDTELEPGKCYCYSENYHKSKKGEKNIIGIHSDTAGITLGHKEGVKELCVAVGGFVLAYVDKEYETGTPLTCGDNGSLTKMRLLNRIFHPERVVATYWKNETADEWGSEDHKVKVNGRRWVKVH